MKSMRFTLTSLLFASLALLTPASAAIDLEEIQPDGFARGVAFSVDGYDASRSPLTNFPVLVRISETGISDFDYEDVYSHTDNGKTIPHLAFTDAEGNALAFDVDTWNNSSTSLVWATLPVMTNGAEFAMFWRATEAAANAAAGGNAFTNYVGVWHLGESGNGQQAIKDATTNNLMASSSTRSLAKSDGVVGGARQITNRRSKGDPALVVNKDDAVIAKLNTLGTNFTFSAWMRPYGSIGNTDSATELSTTAGIGYDVLFSRKNSVSTKAWGVQLMNNPNSMRVFTSQNANPSDTGDKLDFKQNQWGRFDIVYDSTLTAKKTNVSIYWNGERVYGPSQYDLVAQGSETLDIGGFTGGERPFYGAMDEVRVGPFLPSPDWIKADYDQATNAAYLSAGEVVAFAEIPKPVATFSLLDSGAAFAQLGGTITALGEGANSADVYYKVWPVGGTEPASWTLLAPGLGVGDSFEGIVTNLTPQVAYTNLLKAVNDLATPYDSDFGTLPFTTSGAGEAGTGGDAKRVGDSIVHTFTVDPNEGDTWEFVPPSYAESVETLVVGGGGPGGYYAGGGGGAGGLVYNAALPVTGGQTYTVKVGTGGVASSAATEYGTNGGDSLITSGSGAVTNAIAHGGGAGGNGNLGGQTATCPGIAGGSGGGASSGSTYAAGSATPSDQGNAGGGGFTSDNPKGVWGGGGGGAGGSGGTVAQGNTIPAGAGGNGIAYLISGTETYDAGGGGGGGTMNGNANAYGVGGAGGSGIGGTGGMRTPVDESAKQASAGRDGTGSGGGGGSTTGGAYGGGNGGSGVVIIRYPIQGDGKTEPEPAVGLTGATYDAETSKVSFDYRVAWAGYGYQVADVGVVWGYAPNALNTTNIVATDKIGSGSGEIVLPQVSRTVYLRAVAVNAAGLSGVSVAQSVFTLFNPNAPVGTISLSSAAVTNATFAVEVTDFGTGAESASVTVQVCASEDFTGTVLSFPAAETLAALGTVSVGVNGLAQSSTYYARAIVVNDDDVELTTDPVEFTTYAPGAPVATARTGDIGFTTLGAVVRVSDFGAYASGASVRLEVSTQEDFSTLDAVSAEEPIALNADKTLVASGLAPDTYYYRRVRIVNDWGSVLYVAVPYTSTRAVPFAAAGPSWTASGDTVDLSLVVSAVYDGAECTAVLTYGGEEVGTQTFDEAGTVTWSGLAAKADGTVAQIVVTTTVDGADYSKTFSVPVTPGANATAITSITPYCTYGDNALWLRPGDVAMLPDLYGGASYQVLNERFASISGSTLTALEPGIVGIRCVDASFSTNVMGVVVLPDAVGSGSVYVFKESKRNNTYDWARPECWDKVVFADGAATRAASNDSYPQNADDIAILPFNNVGGDIYVRHRTDISIGGLYSGMIRPDANAMCALERYKDDTTKTVTLKRTDGNPVQIVVCPNNDTANNNSRIQLGGYAINAVFESDAVIDGCSSKTNVNGPRGFFQIKDTTDGGKKPTETVCTILLQNVTITFKGYPCYKVDGSGSTAAIYGFWKGTGTLVKEGQGGIVFNNDLGGFSGSFVLKGEKNLGGISAPATQLSLRGGGATNVSATVYGVVAISSDKGAPTSNGGAGVFGTSAQVQAAPPTTDATTTYNGVSGDRGPDAPAKGVTLVGGTWYAGRIDNKTWGKGAKDDKVVDFLSLGPGMSFVSLQPPQGNNGGYPINAVTVESLRQTARGTLAVYDKSRYAVVPQTETNSIFRVANWTDFATGAEGYSVTGAVYQTIPWMISAMNDDWSNTAFASFDAEGRLVYPTRDNVQITEAAENANLYMTGKNLNYGSAGGDYTINSLYISNGDKNRWLGEGRTLRIKSGGLILQGKSAIGLPGRTDNGALVLGDATHPAYVWAKGYNADTNYLGAAVTAAGGFVSAYPGNLCLVGDQTGIADEIAVNGGTLAIGTSENECLLTAGLLIRVCRGAKLLANHANSLNGIAVKLDGAGGDFAKVILPGDRICASLAVRDVYESTEWDDLPEGTYGSSESNAEFVRDDLFVGPGVLCVGAAPTPNGVMFLIY